MRVLLAHLSDIHLESPEDPVLSRTEPLASAISSADLEVDHVLLIVTGDIAQSGKAQQYDLALDFIHRLRSSVATFTHTDVSVVVVPGNHDCDFATETRTRKLLLDAVSSDTFDLTVYSDCVGVQSAFFDFADVVMDPLPAPTRRHPAEWLKISVKGKDVLVRVLNSAWLSRMREVQGRLFLPASTLEAAPPCALNEAVLVISALHHPYPWHEAGHARQLRTTLESQSDIIMTGHEHDALTFARESSGGDRSEYIEGALLQGRGSESSSEFVVVLCDTDRQLQRCTVFSWDGERYIAGNRDVERPFFRNRARLRSAFEPSASFLAFLTDAGAKFTHPRKAYLSLDDIYVSPDLREIDAFSDTKVEKPTFRDALGFVVSEEYVLFVAPEHAGKTALAKKLAATALSAGVVPIFASGREFAPRNSDSFLDGVRRLCLQQYSKAALERFLQLRPEQRLLIFDDFHLLRMSAEHRARLLRTIKQFFGRVALFSADDSRWDELARDLNQSEPEGSLLDYAHVEVLPMGHLRRSDMVRRWLLIGRNPDDLSEEEFLRQARRAETTLSNVLGQNLVPAFPLFVLVVLQQYEATEKNVSLSGSQGYLYEALITAALRGAGTEKDIDASYNYLAELANYLQFLDIPDRAPIRELESWHESYCQRYLRLTDFGVTIRSLDRAGIIRVYNGVLAFAYPYIYYYFIARYLRDHLREDSAQDYVRQLAREMHNERYANILLFLSHLSKDPFILDTVVGAAAELFVDQREWDPARDSEVVNRLVTAAPALILDLKLRPEENRRQELAERDAVEREVAEVQTHAQSLVEESDDRELMGHILQLNSAYKTIQILGQILRNFEGSLAGDRKIQLASTCLSLGFRVLGFYFSNIERSGDDLIRGIVEFTTRKHPEAARDRLLADASSLLFSLSERMTFGVVKHMSDSLGHQDLDPVYSAIIKDRGANRAYDVVDLSVRLDHYDDFPEIESLRSFRRLASNQLGASVLRHLVWHHFHVFLRPVQLRQRVCAELGISTTAEMTAGPRKRLAMHRPPKELSRR